MDLDNLNEPKDLIPYFDIFFNRGFLTRRGFSHLIKDIENGNILIHKGPQSFNAFGNIFRIADQDEYEKAMRRRSSFTNYKELVFIEHNIYSFGKSRFAGVVRVKYFFLPIPNSRVKA